MESGAEMIIVSHRSHPPSDSSSPLEMRGRHHAPFKSDAPSSNFDPVLQKGIALGGSPLPVHIVAPTELHDDRTSGTSKRMEDYEIVAWI